MIDSDKMIVVKCPNEECNKLIYKVGPELNGRVETKCRSCKQTFTITHKNNK